MRKKQHNRSKPCLILRSLGLGGSEKYFRTDRVQLQENAFGDFPTRSSARRRRSRARPRARAYSRRFATQAQAQPATGPAWRHALSLFGDIKYPAGFKRFDYVNPDAPKGGTVRQIAIGTFDNFNVVVAGVKGTLAAGVRLVYESLMTPSLDEVSTEYGAAGRGGQPSRRFLLRHLSSAGARQSGMTASR